MSRCETGNSSCTSGQLKVKMMDSVHSAVNPMNAPKVQRFGMHSWGMQDLDKEDYNFSERKVATYNLAVK